MAAIKKAKLYCDYSTVRLFDSIRRGKNVVIIQTLLQDGANINATDSQGYPPLLLACLNNRVKILDLLIKAGANIDVKYNGDWTVLHHASIKNWIQIIRTLVKIVPDLDARDIRGETALHHASRSGSLEIVQCLVEEGSDINVKEYNGVTPVLLAAKFSNKDVVDLLMKCGANVDATNNKSKYTLLHFASINGWLDVVQSIVKQNYCLDARDINGIPALSFACVCLQFDIVQYLLQAGASWDIEDDFGQSPMNYATKELDFKLIKLFIQNGAYLKSVDYETIVKSSLLKVLLQDREFCFQAIMNKFNHDLTKLYKLPASRSLPRIEKMTIGCGSRAAQIIKQTVMFEIQTQGHCNILEVRPMVLSMFSVRSVLEYCGKK